MAFVMRTVPGVGALWQRSPRAETRHVIETRDHKAISSSAFRPPLPFSLDATCQQAYEELVV